MRGTVGRRINNPSSCMISNVTKQTLFSLQSSSSFSSGSGRGRGRGVPSGSSPFEHFPPTKAPGESSTESKPEPTPSGLGHGRGRPPVPSSSTIPSFSSFISSVKSGAGRGRVTPESEPSQTTESQHLDSPKPPKFTPSELSIESIQPSERNLPSSILSVLSGAGRGKPGVKQVQPLPPPQIKEENRHIRAQSRPESAAPEPGSVRPKLSREEAVKQAMRILSQGKEGEGISSAEAGAASGRGRGRSTGRVRGGGRRRGGGRGRGGERMLRRETEDKDEEYDSDLDVGDNADGEKLAEKIGVENMNKLVEGFEEMSGSVLPSPMEDAYLDAFHTNCMIEFEPEYLMEEFGTNPDIDEKPPIPLRDALEKMKPFLMAYEGIQSHEEWEEAIDEVMERVPLLEEIVEYYSGPDRVTAKRQQEELERIAKTIPENAPASVTRFANRAVLSLQSNPGWGFDKKFQFMDKLAREVSQHYK